MLILTHSFTDNNEAITKIILIRKSVVESRGQKSMPTLIGIPLSK